MYWFTKKNWPLGMATLLLGSATLHSCQQNDKAATSNKAVYFDLPAYFQGEIDSLAKINPEIQKTVLKDEEQESKNLKIKDWAAEFASFKNVDLNKPAYAGAITVDTVDQMIQYRFTNPDLDLSCVQIKLDSAGKPSMVSIEKQVKNKLYNTNEFLVYEKSNYYIVEKNQQLRAMGNNYYKVQGNFLK